MLKTEIIVAMEQGVEGKRHMASLLLG